jgi:hypothetical protein
MKVRPVTTFLNEIGIAGHAQQATARRVLEETGFTRSGRRNMARVKEPAAQEALRRALAFHCSSEACQRSLAEQPNDDRISVLVERHACEICEGSVNKTTLEEMGHALLDAGLSRVVVVGGTNAIFSQIRGMSPQGVQWRFVDGTRRVGAKAAASDLAWADVILIWATTPLPHTVSGLYSQDSRTITVRSRGIAALAREATIFAQRRRAKKESNRS